MKLSVFRTGPGRGAKRPAIARLVAAVSKAEKFAIPRLHVIFADDAYLKKLNRAFFKKNRTTNVIAFNLGDLAEIYVAPGQARDENELRYFIVHGLLHIIGYDHRRPAAARAMDARCRRYVGRAER